MNYYTAPLRFTDLIKAKPHPQCSLKDSIAQHINLLLRTHLGDYRYDAGYGCLIWQKDYHTIRSIYQWKAELMDGFRTTLATYEKRLRQLEVNVDLDELKIVDPNTQKLLELRKRITITVEGIIALTNEPFTHSEQIFFSPLSLS